MCSGGRHENGQHLRRPRGGGDRQPTRRRTGRRSGLPRVYGACQGWATMPAAGRGGSSGLCFVGVLGSGDASACLKDGVAGSAVGLSPESTSTPRSSTDIAVLLSTATPVPATGQNAR